MKAITLYRGLDVHKDSIPIAIAEWGIAPSRYLRCRRLQLGSRNYCTYDCLAKSIPVGQLAVGLEVAMPRPARLTDWD